MELWQEAIHSGATEHVRVDAVVASSSEASCVVKYEIHVGFNKGMWWAMPHDLSDSILEEWFNGSQQVSFIWDWKESCRGSWQSDGAETSINRYIIDFDTMFQRNIDNERTRKVKVVCILR